MARHLVLPEANGCVTIAPDHERSLSDDEYFAFCMANPDVEIERSADGEIHIMPPAGGESSSRNADLSIDLGYWARQDGRGRTFDSSAQFLLPDGSGLSPDASWVESTRLAGVSAERKRKFLPVVPNFVVEILSPSDRRSRARTKMRCWVDNGVELAWLIDADRRTIEIWRPGVAPEQRVGIEAIEGDGPVKGFRLNLQRIWEGL